MRRRANYIVALISALAFVAVRFLSLNSNSWTTDSPVKVWLGAVFVALIAYAVCVAIDWIAGSVRSRPKDRG